MKAPDQEAFPKDARDLRDALTASKNLTENYGNLLPDLRREARAKLLEFFWLQSADKPLAVKCALLVYGPVCAYESSLRRFKIHREGPHYFHERLPAGKSAVAGLRRLQRHAAAGGYLWTKAWAEATPAAQELIFTAAARPISIPISGAPDSETVAPFIPAALKLASAPRARKVERDQAVIAILRAYQTLYDSRPTNPAKTTTQEQKRGQKHRCARFATAEDSSQAPALDHRRIHTTNRNRFREVVAGRIWS